MREAPSVGQYIKQYDKQSGKHCGNKYVATTPFITFYSKHMHAYHNNIIYNTIHYTVYMIYVIKILV